MDVDITSQILQAGNILDNFYARVVFSKNQATVGNSYGKLQ